MSTHNIGFYEEISKNYPLIIMSIIGHRNEGVVMSPHHIPVEVAVAHDEAQSLKHNPHMLKVVCL